jgi:hypothetical protein
MGEMTEDELEIAPEPDDVETAAIAKALEAASAKPQSGRSAWWQEGQREALRERPTR